MSILRHSGRQRLCEVEASRLNRNTAYRDRLRRTGARGKAYFAADSLSAELLPDDEDCRRRITELCERSGVAPVDEPMPKPGTLGFRVQPYGIKTWGDLYTPRQLLCLLTFAEAVW